MKLIRLLAIVSLIILICSCHSEDQNILRIATAANAQYAMKALAQEFEGATGFKTEIVIASSGKITAQIQQGAPYHIFISADMKYPLSLYEKGFTTDRPEIYALGTLVLWTIDPNIRLYPDILDQSNFTHLAIANPKTAPYGQAAVEALKYYNKYQKVAKKIVTGESVGQANQYVLSSAAELGFTALSVVLAPELKSKCYWVEINEESHNPIEQGVVILNNQPDKINQATSFYNFLFSKNGQKILKQFGYKVNIAK